MNADPRRIAPGHVRLMRVVETNDAAPDPLDGLVRAAFHAREAITAYAREDTSGAARHLAHFDRIGEEIGAWLAELGDDAILAELEQLESLR